MNFKLAAFSYSIAQGQAENEIIKCNDFTADYGLVLTSQQAVELVETRSYALGANGRIEFGGGVIDKIIKEFCDSPYISINNYADTLHDLIKIFYYYKNETLDLLSDDDLIKFMKESFNGICRGSIELLTDRELEKMANNLRYGRDLDYSDDEMSEDEGEEDEYE